MNSPPVIKVDQLCYSYRKTSRARILDGLDLAIAPGDYLLISGSSGCGKSTLCRTFNGLIPHFYDGIMSGTVYVAGTPTTATTIGDLFSRVAMVFQNPEAQLFSTTVEGEIAFGLESLGLARREIRTRIAAITEGVGLTDLIHRNPRNLSGGEQYLVSTAACLAIQPRLIILDEPYANLDPVHVLRLRDILKSINRRGTAVVICEHRLGPTIPDVNRMVVVHQGRIVLDGPPERILSTAVEQYGLAVPFVVKAGLKTGQVPLPLTQKELAASISPADLTAVPRPVLVPPIKKNTPIVLRVEALSSIPNNNLTLKNIHFSLAESECLALVGANGAGKTTLARHLIGLLHPDTGRIDIMGKPADQMKTSELARYAGLAFQNPHNQFFKQTVREEIEVGPRMLNCLDTVWIDSLVTLFRLEKLLDRPPYRLSAGEKKRVAFAAALAVNPPILILDEPTAGQDGHFRKALGRCLENLRKRGHSVIMITHDLAFAEQYAHRWLLMAEGEIIARGMPADVMSNQKAMTRAGLAATDTFELFYAGRQAPLGHTRLLREHDKF